MERGWKVLCTKLSCFCDACGEVWCNDESRGEGGSGGVEFVVSSIIIIVVVKVLVVVFCVSWRWWYYIFVVSEVA